MTMMSGAQMVVRTLEDLGVEHLFGYPGGAVLDIYDALLESKKIKHILGRHEQGVAHAADGYARATGKVGVCLVTSGPGATNTVTSIATAYMDSIPMVVLTGQVFSPLIGSDAFQEVDTVGITRPIVKHSYLCQSALDIPKYIRQAFYLASTGRPGPVVVDIPKDCVRPSQLFEYPEQDGPVKMRSYNPTRQGHRGQVKRAANMIAKACKPIMLVGGGALLSAFEANHAMHNADIVFAVGCRFDDRVTNNLAKFCPEAKIIHVDIDPASISKTVTADIPIVGDAKTVLNQFKEAFDEFSLQENKEAMASWWDSISAWRSTNCLGYRKDPTLIQPQEIIEAVYKATDGKAVIATDVGQHQMFTALYYKFDEPRHFLTSGGLGTMGYGFPAAIGAKVGCPDAEVCLFTGDGSFQMNIQELSTCLEFGIPVKIFILDNHTLGMVRQWQRMFYKGHISSTNLNSNPDFVALAKAYGHEGIRVTAPEELDAAVAKALSMKDKLVIVDIVCNTDAKVLPMQQGGGNMAEMFLNEDK